MCGGRRYGRRMTEHEAFAVELAHAAAAETLPLFRGDCEADNKLADGGFDPVTAADRNAEAAIRRLIAERYPHHGVIGEEYGEDRPDAEHVWVLDPVDGTRAFITNCFLFGTLIALERDDADARQSVALALESARQGIWQWEIETAHDGFPRKTGPGRGPRAR